MDMPATAGAMDIPLVALLLRALVSPELSVGKKTHWTGPKFFTPLSPGCLLFVIFWTTSQL